MAGLFSRPDCFRPFRVPLVVAAIFFTAAFSFSAPVFCGNEEYSEEAAVFEAARKFLDAEVRGDHRAVYDCLAPSSYYVRKNSYEQYLSQALASEDRLVDYTIVGITYVEDNENRDKWPSVEKFAQVVVDLVFLHVPTQQRSEINIGFIFMKEDGKWFKS